MMRTELWFVLMSISVLIAAFFYYLSAVWYPLIYVAIPFAIIGLYAFVRGMFFSSLDGL